MAKKIELHVDALVAIVLLFAAAVGVIAFQRYQYSNVAQDNIDRQYKQMMLELEVARLKSLLVKAGLEDPAVPGARKKGE